MIYGLWVQMTVRLVSSLAPFLTVSSSANEDCWLSKVIIKIQCVDTFKPPSTASDTGWPLPQVLSKRFSFTHLFGKFSVCYVLGILWVILLSKIGIAPVLINITLKLEIFSMEQEYFTSFLIYTWLSQCSSGLTNLSSILACKNIYSLHYLGFFWRTFI